MIDCEQSVVVVVLRPRRIGLLVELIRRVYGPVVEWLVSECLVKFDVAGPRFVVPTQRSMTKASLHKASHCRHFLSFLITLLVCWTFWTSLAL